MSLSINFDTAGVADLQIFKSGVRRDAGLDALRASLTLLVLFHHAAITYGASGDWYYTEVRAGHDLSSLLLSLFTGFNQAFFMGLFFLLAGYFTPGAVERHGPFAYLRERALRLGLPLLLYFLLLSPVWGVIIGLLHVFTKRLEASGQVWRSLARRAYAIYIIHPPVLVALALAWRSVAAPLALKFVVTGIATCFACYLLAGLLLKAPGLKRVL